jgi:hypothetical protein
MTEHWLDTIDLAREPQWVIAQCECRLRDQPTDFHTFSVVARILLRGGMKQELWALCEELRSRDVWQGHIPSAMVYSATDSRQMRMARALMNFDSWFLEVELGLPKSFNQSLSRELLEHEGLGPLSATNSTIGTGRRIDRLDVVGGPMARKLLAEIKCAVDRYITDRLERCQDDMVVRAPSEAGIRAWATTLGADGYDVWHVHPGGWISGVYYVSVPYSEPGCEAGRDGCIEFGSFPFVSEERVMESHVIRPRNGVLLVFPSHFSHRTWPTGLEVPRVCIAFDVVPAK